jgi:hypothetical protein
LRSSDLDVEGRLAKGNPDAPFSAVSTSRDTNAHCAGSLATYASNNYRTLTEVSGDVSGYRERLFKFVETQKVELSFSERIAPAKGLSHGGKITLLSGMQPAEEFSTLVHEIAHEMLHRGERRTLTTKQVRETEAEAVAFVVCQSIGLRNGTASQDYVAMRLM